MRPASSSLRLLAFAVPAALGVSAIQPLLAALTGQVSPNWALQLAAPALLTAGLMMVAARLTDRTGEAAPPWYSAWALLPGSFILAGAASMCVFAAFVELPQIRVLGLAFLVAGALTWAAALTWVRRAAK
ncbi:MAG: hypothetical protein M3Z98_00210 [Candidatus Dormibacteraeota bacterium]|nr:hypothetical protein [Candidatus Dormibacteraeota bacterium]